MHLVHMIGSRDVRIRMAQKVRLERVAFQVDTEPSAALVDMGEAFPVRAVAYNASVVAVEGVILIS